MEVAAVEEEAAVVEEVAAVEEDTTAAVMAATAEAGETQRTPCSYTKLLLVLYLTFSYGSQNLPGHRH